MKNEAEFKERVLANLDRSTQAFNNGDPAFFDDFAKDATIFTVESAQPVKGRDAYRQSHQAQFTRSRREKTILDRNVQIVGDVAVVAQTARIKQADLSATVRQTFVFGDTDEGIKVKHLHTALVDTGPTAAVNPGAVRVISDKIATVSAVLGVAQ